MCTVSLRMSVFEPIEEYFRQAVRSTLDQSFEDFELILVDDCSSAPVAELLGRHMVAYGCL